MGVMYRFETRMDLRHEVRAPTALDCFIIYCPEDQKLAQWVHGELLMQGLSAFLAPVSADPDVDWSETVGRYLRDAAWVIVLASRAACASALAGATIGGAPIASDRILPVVWDMAPAELPPWLHGFPVIGLRADPLPQLHKTIERAAARATQDRSAAIAAVRAVGAGLLALRLLQTERT